MDLPTVLTGMQRINQIVGTTNQPFHLSPDSTAISLALFMGVLRSSEPPPFKPPTENAANLRPPLQTEMANNIYPVLQQTTVC